jgi:hypothetical protein
MDLKSFAKIRVWKPKKTKSLKPLLLQKQYKEARSSKTMMLNKTGSLKNEKNQQNACPKKISMVGALKGTAKAVQHTRIESVWMIDKKLFAKIGITRDS